MEPKKGFLSNLFDFSFSEFITTKVIKAIYVFLILVSAIGAIAVISRNFSISAGSGIITLILSPIIFLLYVLFSRIWLELIIVIFRIADNTTRLADSIKDQNAAPQA